MLLQFTVFISGWVVMSLEFAGSRVLQRYFGSGLIVWGSLISTFMAAMALGYYVGGKLADRKPSGYVGVVGLGISAAWIALVPFFAEPLCEKLVYTITDERMASLLGASALFLPANFLLAWISPLAVRLQSGEVGSVGRVAGRTSAVWTIGSICGTLVTAFFLISEVGVRKTFFISAGLLAATAVVLAIGSGKDKLGAER